MISQVDLEASSAWHVLSAFIIFILGIFGALSLSKSFNCSSGRALLLYLWHTFFCLVHLVYVKMNHGDSIMYFNTLKVGWGHNMDKLPLYSIGTAFIRHLTQFLKLDLNLSFLGVFLVFNIFGFVGLLAFDASLRKALLFSSQLDKYFATVLVFLPSISFWTASLNKDAISFMAIGLMMWGALEPSRRSLLMFFSIFLMLLVRPHMAGLMTVALIGAIIFGAGKMSFWRRTCIAALAVPIAAYAISIVLTRDFFMGEGVRYLFEAIEVRQGYMAEGAGTVDVGNMSFPMQVFTYLFRPLFFEAHNFSSLIASIDNVIILVFFVFAFRNLWVKKFSGPLYLCLWLYAILSLWILAATTTNMGISARQKWMCVPVLIFLFSAGLQRISIFRRNVRLERAFFCATKKREEYD